MLIVLLLLHAICNEGDEPFWTLDSNTWGPVRAFTFLGGFFSDLHG